MVSWVLLIHIRLQSLLVGLCVAVCALVGCGCVCVFVVHWNRLVLGWCGMLAFLAWFDCYLWWLVIGYRINSVVVSRYS